MKKNFFCFFIAFCLIISCAFFTRVQTNVLYADGSVTGLTMALYQSTLSTELPLENTNNVYSVKFNENFSDDNQISESNLPYKRYYVGVTISTSPVIYEDLGYVEQVTIFTEIKNSLTVNGATVEFNNLTATTNDYKIELQGDFSSRVNMSIYCYKAGALNLSCSAGNYVANMTIKYEYAIPSVVNISTNGSLNQLYENYSPISFTASFNHTKYLDPNANYTYKWFLDAKELDIHSNYLQLLKDKIKIGTFKLKLEIKELPLLVAQKTIVITTEVGYQMELQHTGGEMQQTIGNNNPPITFSASIPTTENYVVNWYLKTAETNIYHKQEVDGNGLNYFFDTPKIASAYGAGTYKLFAEATLTETNVTVRSDTYVIILETKAVEEQKKFEIKCEEYDNASTSVTAYECSVDANEYYKEDEIVWSINGIQYAQGSHFNFEPQFADEYVISVRLRNASGTSVNSITVKARTVESANIWLFLGIGAGLLVVLCVLSIIISNKKREKIW